MVIIGVLFLGMSLIISAIFGGIAPIPSKWRVAGPICRKEWENAH